MTTHSTTINNRVLGIAIALVLIDFVIKLWVLFTLDTMEAGAGIGTPHVVGLMKVYNFSAAIGNQFFQSISLVIKLVWLVFFGFLFFRARRTAAPMLLQVGSTLAFVSIAATHVDMYLFPRLDPSITPSIGYLQLDEFYINLGSSGIATSLTALLVKLGVGITAVGAITSLTTFRKLFRRQR